MNCEPRSLEELGPLAPGTGRYAFLGGFLSEPGISVLQLNVLQQEKPGQKGIFLAGCGDREIMVTAWQELLVPCSGATADRKHLLSE